MLLKGANQLIKTYILERSAENIISNSVCDSKSSSEDKPNLRESNHTSVNSLVGLNTKLFSTIEWPVYEDVEPVSAVELNSKGDSSPKLHKISLSSYTFGVQVHNIYS
jgi:hypothetical protein